MTVSIAELSNTNADASSNPQQGQASPSASAAPPRKSVTGTDGNDVILGSDAADQLAGGAGSDTLVGGDGDDLLEGGIGNDLLNGGAGWDVYLFGKNDGDDTIRSYDSTPNKQDAIRFTADVAPADVYLRRVGDALRVSIRGGGSILVENYFLDEATAGYQTELIRFADGTTWGSNSIRLQVLAGRDDADTLTGYASDDRISGLAGDDSIHGRSGNDLLEGGDGQDEIFGDAGQDSLFGGSGNDRLDGGDGDDLLKGELGNDTLLGGAGNDTLADGKGDNLLDGGDGDDLLRIKGDGNNELRGGDGNDALSIDGNGKNLLVGGAGKDTLTSGHGDDTLDGGAGDDTYYGLLGKTTIVFGAGSGHDTASGFGNPANTVQLKDGITAADVTVRRDANNQLVLTLKGSDDSFVVSGYYDQGHGGYSVPNIQFADGTRWNKDEIDRRIAIGTEGADVLYSANSDSLIRGLAGNDELHGSLGHDTLDGGTGNDTLYGSYGHNTYLFGKGYGQDLIAASTDAFDYDSSPDLVQLGAGIGKQDVTLQRDGRSDNLRLTLKGSTDSLLISNYYQGGARGNQYATIQFADGSSWSFDDVNKILTSGTAGNDLITGTDGADLLQGQAGNDTIYGGAGNDTLLGGAGDDRLSGDAGNDSLVGGAGRDTYLFSRGSGQDTIDNLQGENALFFNGDSVLFANGITTKDVKLSASRDDLVLSLSGGADTLRIKGYFSLLGLTNATVQNIKFADGTSWNYATVLTKVLFPRATSAVAEVTGAANESGTLTPAVEMSTSTADAVAVADAVAKLSTPLQAPIASAEEALSTVQPEPSFALNSVTLNSPSATLQAVTADTAGLRGQADLLVSAMAAFAPGAGLETQPTLPASALLQAQLAVGLR